MARKHFLDGLVKWSQREPWMELFEDLVDQHFGPPCEEMGVDPSDLPDILAPIEFVKLWNCVLEDMVAADIDGQNLADQYLKRRGWKESAVSRNLIRALRQSVMSLYEVSGIRRDQGFFLRDLIRGGEPVWVHERMGTHQAKDLDILAMRLVTVNGRMEIGGVVLPFKRSKADELRAQLEYVAKATPDDIEAAFRRLAEDVGETIDEELGEVLDAIKKKANLTIDEMLASSAFVFTQRWLCQILEERLRRSGASAEPHHGSLALQPEMAEDTMRDGKGDDEQYDVFEASRKRA